METVEAQILPLERRSYTRKTVRIYAFYVIDIPFNQGFFVSKNISGAGLLFKSNMLIPAGTTIHLNLLLPGTSNPLVAKAEAMRCEDVAPPQLYEIAVAFTDISDDDREKLVEYLNQR